ncbi:MAG: hypothetical protein ACI4HI_09025 [Lachnospiraceae bacterium]
MSTATWIGAVFLPIILALYCKKEKIRVTIKKDIYHKMMSIPNDEVLAGYEPSELDNDKNRICNNNKNPLY